MELTELSKEEFAEFVSMQKCNNFLQSDLAYQRYIDNKKEAYLCGVKSNGKLLGVALAVCTGLQLGKKVFLIPGGPVLSYEDENTPEIMRFLVLELQKFLKARGGLVVYLTPNIKYETSIAKILASLKCKELGEFISVKWIAELDLTNFESEDEMLMSFNQSHRRYIRYSENRYNVNVRPLKYDELDILVDLVGKAAERHHFNVQPLSYYQQMYRSFGDKVKFMLAESEGKKLAAGMFMLYGDEVTYLYSGSDAELNKYCGSYALQWYMLRYALENGFKRYNFYGVRPVDGNGVYEFKKGFRAEVVEKMGCFALPLCPAGKLVVARKKYQKFGEVA